MKRSVTKACYRIVVTFLSRVAAGWNEIELIREFGSFTSLVRTPSHPG